MVGSWKVLSCGITHEIIINLLLKKMPAGEKIIHINEMFVIAGKSIIWKGYSFLTVSLGTIFLLTLLLNIENYAK
jgi:hypothetical protein